MDSSTNNTAKRIRRHANDDDIMQIRMAYENGFKPLAISHMLNMKAPTVYGIIKKYKESWAIETNKRCTKLLNESEVVQEMWQICRFCLSQEEETLSPITNILDSYLTIENVERFTGVYINLNDRTMSAVCSNCTNILQNSILFRFSCIRNDAYLQEQLPAQKATSNSSKAIAYEDHDPLAMDYTVFKTFEPTTTVQSSSSKPILKTKKTPNLMNVKKECNSASYIEARTNQNSDSQPILNTAYKSEIVDVKEELNIVNYMKSNTAQESASQSALNATNTSASAVVEEELNAGNRIEPAKAQDSNSQPTLNATNTSVPANIEELYSANYIELGEPTSSDNEEWDEPKNLTPERNSKKKIRIYKNGVNVVNISAYAGQKMLCNICGIFVQSIASHLAVHRKKGKYACPHCPLKMSHEAPLTRHINAVHLRIDMKTCEYCGKRFTHKIGLLAHLRALHGIGTMYECKVCFKKYRHPGGLREHRRTHSLRVPQYHECETCGKGFKKRESLRVHQRVHSSEKHYACSECPKRFKSSYARNTHQLTHSGILFKCTICDKSYRYKTLLNIHLRKTHSSNDDPKN